MHKVPGNHDINPASTTADAVLAQLAHFKATFGEDYTSFRTKYAAFVLANTEMLIAPYLGLNGTTDNRVLEPVEAQWSWLETQLAAGNAAKPHVIMVLHHPPFLNHEDEPDQYFNTPQVPRRRLLSLAKKYNVSHMLCGHTHTTRDVKSADNSITVLTTAGTSRTFDTLGCGFRTITMTESSIEIQYNPLPNKGGYPGCIKKPRSL